MSDLLIIYDPELEVGAIIDTETRMGYGPAMVGPHSKQLLQLFLDAVPFDMDRMATTERAQAFTSFLERSALAATGEVTTGTEHQVVPEADTTVDTTARAAEAEAHAAGTVPAPQPADTDLPQGEGTTSRVAPDAQPGEGITATGEQDPTTKTITCANCQGTGTTNDGPDGGATQCRLCQGTGKVTIPVQP